jgi:hypothetical protein
MKTMKRIIQIALIVIPLVSYGQKRTTIKDPEIEFSLEIPKKWQGFNTDLYFYVIPPKSNDDEHLAITYVEADSANLSYLFEFTIKDLYKLNEPNYKLIDKGTDTVGSSPAEWAIFESKVNSIEYKSVLYFFRQSGQTFKLRGTARKANYEKLENGFLSIIKSMESNKIKPVANNGEHP